MRFIAPRQPSAPEVVHYRIIAMVRLQVAMGRCAPFCARSRHSHRVLRRRPRHGHQRIAAAAAPSDARIRKRSTKRATPAINALNALDTLRALSANATATARDLTACINNATMIINRAGLVNLTKRIDVIEASTTGMPAGA